MPDIRFGSLNYATIYSAAGTRSHRMGRDCCFHTVIKDRPISHMDNNYRILVFKGDKYMQQTYRNNCCVLTLEEVKKYLQSLKQYCKFSYSVIERHVLKKQVRYLALEEDDYKDYTYYQIDLHIDGNILIHKFVLKMIRPLYEFPYNMYWLEAKHLSNISPFRKYGFMNLYKMIANIYRAGCNYGSSDQFICDVDRASKFISIKEFKTLINTSHLYSINNLQPYSTIDIQSIQSEYRTLCREVLLNDCVRNLNYWTEIPERRLNLYKNIIKFHK